MYSVRYLVSDNSVLVFACFRFWLKNVVCSLAVGECTTIFGIKGCLMYTPSALVEGQSSIAERASAKNTLLLQEDRSPRGVLEQGY